MISEETLSDYIATRLRELREAYGYSINGLSYRSGISQSYLRSIELQEKNNISVEILFKITQELNISLSDFFSDYKPPVNKQVSSLDKKIHALSKEQQESLLRFLETIN